MVEVSGVAASNFVLQNQTEQQDRLQDLRIQASSGKKAQTFDGIASEVRRLESLKSDFTNNKAFQRNTEQTQLRLKEMESAISDLQDIASKFRTDLLSAANDGGNLESIDLGTIASTFRNEVQGVLNNEQGGRFLFAGTATKTQAVSFQNVSDVGDIKNGEFFQGNNDVVKARITETTTVDYGVTADVGTGSGAQKLLSAIQRVIDGPSSEQAVEESIRDLTGGQADAVVKNLGANEITDPTANLDSAEGGGFNSTDTITVEVNERGGTTVASETVTASNKSLADVAADLSDTSSDLSVRVANQGGDVQLEVFSNDDSTELTANVPSAPGATPTVQQDVRVDGAIAELADTRSAIGTTRDLVETTQTRLDDNQTRLNNDISDVEDIELQRTLTLLSENQQSLQASFATTSRLQQTSILNFLR